MTPGTGAAARPSCPECGCDEIEPASDCHCEACGCEPYDGSEEGL